MMDPCETYVKEAKRNLSLFKKNFWTAGLFYLNAAECYHSAGNKEKAYKNAIEAVKLLEKYWNKTNDVVLPDLEKALGLAFEIAPKKEKKKIAKKAYEVYMYHALRLESAGNYLGAAEKYELAIQYALDTEQAKKAILRAVAILEKALEKPSVIRKKEIREKIEEKLDYLKGLLPEEPSKAEIQKATEKLFLFVELDVVKDSFKTVLSQLKDSLSVTIDNYQLDESDGQLKLSVDFGRYSAYLEVACEKNLCDLKIFASNIMGLVLIFGDVMYHLDKNSAVNEILKIEFEGSLKRDQLETALKYIERKVATRYEAQKLIHWLDVALYFLGLNKKMRKIVLEGQKIINDLKEAYIFDVDLLPTDSSLLRNYLADVLEEMKKKW